MNKLMTKRSLQTQAEAEDAIAQAIAKAKQERDEMKQKYEKKIQNLKKEVTESRMVLQALVLVARMSPEEFFALIESEADNWQLADLKHIAASVENRLQLVKKTKAGKDNDKIDVQMVSTAQRLCTYLLVDTKCDKTALIHCINELHKELNMVEVSMPPKEIEVMDQENEEDDSKWGTLSKGSFRAPMVQSNVPTSTMPEKGTPSTSLSGSHASETSRRSAAESVKDLVDNFENVWDGSGSKQ